MAAPTPVPEGEKPDAPGSRKRLVLWAGVAAAAVALAVGAALFLTPRQSEEPVEPKAAVVTNYEFPKIKADLKPTGRYFNVVTLQIVLELAEADVPRLEERKIKILDGFNVRLRELQRADLVGTSGIEGLRADFLGVVNDAIAPAQAKDVLFTEMLVQ